VRNVDVAIIGAGHAGLNALKEIRKTTDNWVLINGGQMGTTCARVGCMPSKAIIELSAKHSCTSLDRKVFPELIPDLLEKVRDYRDIFVDLVLANSTDNMLEGKELLHGYASFLAPNLLEVNGEKIQANSIVLASGSSPAIPGEWQYLEDRMLTSEDLFELDNLPNSVAVIGLGYVGLEMAQALHRLGVEVVGINHCTEIAGISDPDINLQAIEIFSREFPLYLGHPAELNPEGDRVRVKAGELDTTVEKIFVAVGRQPNIPAGLDQFCVTDARGIPLYNPATLQVGDLPIFIAGDAMGDRMLLQDAAEEGRKAGINACAETPKAFKAKTPMSIMFSDPNVCHVGAKITEIPDAIVGQQRFGPIGRALIMGSNRGSIRLYAQPGSGKLLGASMVGPRVEHLAHLVAWAIQLQLSVEDLLEMPFYHPVIEEALQDALKETARELNKSNDLLAKNLGRESQITF